MSAAKNIYNNNNNIIMIIIIKYKIQNVQYKTISVMAAYARLSSIQSYDAADDC